MAKARAKGQEITAEGQETIRRLIDGSVAKGINRADSQMIQCRDKMNQLGL